MSGPREPRDISPDIPPDQSQSWPQRDLSRQRDDNLPGEADAQFDRDAVEAEGALVNRVDEQRGSVENLDPAGTFAQAGPVPAEAFEPARETWDPRQSGERRRPTTAEQAVPWLVGLVLALAGIIIVLLALIFGQETGGLGATGETPLAIPSASAPASPGSVVTASPSASPTATPRPTPTPPPIYGRLEMLYLSRPNTVGTSQLFRDDFATSAAGTAIASSTVDISHYAVAPDGTRSVAVISGKLVGLVRGKPNRTLANLADAATFGADGSTVYAVKITRGGTNDDATLLAITFASGKTTTLTTINYRHPAAQQFTTLGAARFLDDGGSVRIYATRDGNLVLWIAKAGQWRVDPVNGSVVGTSRQPTLWSADGSHRISMAENGLVTTLSELAQDGRTVSRTSVTGLVSHLRWSPRGDRVAFTLGINQPGGGVRQDLYTWDLGNGRTPTALTANGASFGAEWLGSAQFWVP